MPVSIPDLRLRSSAWTWGICILLLLATTVNYLDRLTFNVLAPTILEEFRLNKQQYGYLESAFGSAFALGAILSGWLADRINIRWLYVAAVLAWSVVGFLTGFAQDFATLLVCRILLGLAESANWPCGLRTTQHLLRPQDRAMGNSLLQSGAAVGALLTPLIVLPLLHYTGSWRAGFCVIGAAGCVWAVAWLLSVRSADLALKTRPPHNSLVKLLAFLLPIFAFDMAIHILCSEPRPWLGDEGNWLVTQPWLPLSVKVVVTVLGVLVVFRWMKAATADEVELPRKVFLRRFWALATMVVMINCTWHFLRAWMPLFLHDKHGYSVEYAGWFSMPYYLAADFGSIIAGVGALVLARGLGWSTHGSRLAVYAIGAGLTTFTLAIAVLPTGYLLLGTFLIVGFGALGVFPLYYSLSQDLTTRHQGKLTGALGCICWMSLALLQEVVGYVVHHTGSYTQIMSLAGLAPLVGLVALLFLWGPATAPRTTTPPDAPSDTWRATPGTGEAIQAPGPITVAT